MLALKHLTILEPHARVQLLDLPNELVDQIVKALSADAGSVDRDLVPLSLTCRRLRNAVAPLLYHTLRIRLTHRYVDRRTFNILVNLVQSPKDFSHHITHIKQNDAFCFREDGCEALNLENELVREIATRGLHTLSSVRTISVGCLNSPLLQLMTDLFPDQEYNIRTNACTCSPWIGRSSWSYMEALCQSPVEHKFAFSTSSHNRQKALEPWSKCHPSRTTALSWSLTKYQITGASSIAQRSLAHFNALRELHLKGPNLDFDAQEVSSMLLSNENLTRLSLVGPALCSAALLVVSKLQKLESLRLNSPLDRIFHAHLRNHDFEGLPYLRLPRLRSLEIRYISRYLSIEHVVPKTLQHLRIEYHNRNERLTPYDLRWIARNTPGLTCLEINTGDLSNLWHPTAIAGVDVDMDVYGILDALSSFKHLRRLRLFPSYWQSTAGYLLFVQPVSDEKAVKIYNHLRIRCTNLHLLIISNSYLDYRSRNEVFSRGLSEPVKWVVRSTGGKTHLTTHEAKKNYHLEQIWEGERRLTMTTMRHTGPKLHFDELEDWILPMHEFPFDEPQSCQTQTMIDGLHGTI